MPRAFVPGTSRQAPPISRSSCAFMVLVVTPKPMCGTWRPTGEKFWTVAIDMLGHGWTDKPSIDYQIADYAGHVLSVLKSLGRSKAHITGESLGGWVAAYLAVHHPGSIEKLVLNTAGGWTAHPEVMARLKSISNQAAEDPSWDRIKGASRISDVRPLAGQRRSHRDQAGDLRAAGICRHDETDHVPARHGSETKEHDLWNSSIVRFSRPPWLFGLHMTRRQPQRRASRLPT